MDLERGLSKEELNESERSEKIRARIKELLPIIVPEITSEVESKWGKVPRDIMNRVLSTLDSYDIARMSGMAEWSHLLYREAVYSKRESKILRAIISEFRPNIYYILHEEELLKMGKYLSDHKLGIVNRTDIAEISKVNPAWIKFLNWYKSSHRVNVLQKRLGLESFAFLGIPEPTPEEIRNAIDYEKARRDPSSRVNYEGEYSFEPKMDRRTSRKPNLSEQEGEPQD